MNLIFKLKSQLQKWTKKTDSGNADLKKTPKNAPKFKNIKKKSGNRISLNF